MNFPVAYSDEKIDKTGRRRTDKTRAVKVRKEKEKEKNDYPLICVKSLIELEIKSTKQLFFQ